MIPSQPLGQPEGLADQVAQSADHAVKPTGRVANGALDSLADTVQVMRRQAAPLLRRATEQASALARRGVESVRDTSQRLRDNALRASDSTVNYIKNEPVKATLIAVATGAALIALASLMSRSRDRG